MCLASAATTSRVLPWKLDEHRKAAVAFDERRDVRVACSGKKISFPMARNGAILGLGGSLADRDHIEYVPLSILGLAAFGVTHLPPCKIGRASCRERV